METFNALIELFPSRAPYLFILVGVSVILAGIVPFRINKAGWTVQNPRGKAARISLVIVGVLILSGSIYAGIRLDDTELAKLSKKRIASYFSYATITGSEAECAIGQCRLAFRDSALVFAPRGQDVSFVSRVKTSGQIVSFNTSPRADILNPEQYPSNPTFVEFKIRPASPADRRLQAQGEVVIQKSFSASKGKVGPHLPYYTEYAVFVLDLRSLDFKLQAQVEPKIETKRSDGALISGYITPRMNVFEDGRVYVITATNISAGSSLYVSWGK